MRTRVIGTGFVTGEHLIPNERFTRIFDTSDEWIRERSGIEQRYIAADGTSTSDLGARAAERALADAKVSKEEIDYVVFATMTPDHYFPGSGGSLVTKLGMPTLPALDIRQQCSGFVYGLQVCDALLRAGTARRILFVGAEVHSGFMPFSKTQWDVLFERSQGPVSEEDRAWATKFRDRVVLFGDAAGAMVLEAREGEAGVLGFAIHSDGSKLESLYVPSGGFANRPYFSDAHFREGRHVPVMDGRNVFKAAVTKMPEAVREVCAKAGVSVAEIDMLIAHQANLRINEAVQRSLELPDSRVYNNIQRYGNTTAATIPIAYDECRRQGLVKPGMLVCFVGLGAGFHWGAALMRE